jgi:hypothetical protein
LLSKIELVLTTAQVKSAKEDLKLLANLLAGCSHANIKDFVTEVATWQSKSQLKGAQSKELRTDVVAAYLRDLRSFESDNIAFDQAALRLKADKKVREQEMREIASQYLGYKISKKKNFAWQAIVDRQAVSARQTARSPHQV